MKFRLCILYIFTALTGYFFPLQAQDSLNITLVHRIPLNWNEVEQVDVMDGYLYAGTPENGIRVVDVSDPTDPFEVNSYEPGGTIEDIKCTGSFLHAAAHFDGYLLLDTSDPLNIQESGRLDTPGITRLVSAIDTTAFVIDDYGVTTFLLTIDISEPENPVQSGSLQLGSEARDIYYENGYVFIAGLYQGFYVVDVSDIEQPEIITTYPTDSGLTDVWVMDDTAFLASRYDFIILDISNPDEPGDLYSESFPWVINDIIAEDDDVYLMFGGRIETLDISDPTSPQPLGLYNQLGTSLEFVLNENSVYVADGTYGLSIIDTQNPANPVAASSMKGPGDAIDAVKTGNYIIAANSSGLVLLDAEYPEEGFPRTDIDIDALEVKVSGDNTFVLDSDGFLHILDISDFQQPEEVFLFNIDGFLTTITPNESVAYLGAKSGLAEYHLLSLDIANMESPEIIGSLDLPAEVNSINIQDTLACLTCGEDGSYLVDISDPEFPSFAGEFDPVIPIDHKKSAFFQEHLLIADAMNGLVVLDISDLENLEEVNLFEARGSVQDVEVHDIYALMATGNEGVQVVNLWNPSNPVEVGYYDTREFSASLSESGGSIYVADGLDIYVMQFFYEFAAEEQFKQIFSNVLYPVNVYPNPFNSTLTINLGNMPGDNFEARITDILGRTLINLHRDDFINNHSFTWEPAISSGTYVLSIYNNSQLLNKQRLIHIK